MTRPANACSPGGRRGSTGPLIPCPPVAYAPTTSMTATMSPCRSIAPGLALSPSGPAIWSGASTMRSPAALRGSLLGPRNLALINDRQGTTLAAMRGDGTSEDNVSFFTKDPFGGLIGATSQGGPLNTETGFAGASTPNASGGFIYLRNRWYDPKTGRFLTQDPIGLAGGVNLYSYAGNNPVSFGDPFGLCPPDNPDDFSDCEPGSSGWYANRVATGEGNQVLNQIGGVLSSCGESFMCNLVLDVASLGGSALERRVATRAVEEGA